MSQKVIVRLNSPDKGMSVVRGPLNKLLSKLLYERDITIAKFGNLMKAYLVNPINGMVGNPVKQQQERSNFIKDFTKPNITFENLQKNMKFMDFIDYDLAITARHRDGSTVHVSYNVVLELTDADNDD